MIVFESYVEFNLFVNKSMTFEHNQNITSVVQQYCLYIWLQQYLEKNFKEFYNVTRKIM